MSYVDGKCTSKPSSVETLHDSYDSGVGSSSLSSYHVNGMLEATRLGSHSERDFTSDNHGLPVDNSPLAESYTDGQHNFYDLKHTPDLDDHCGNTITTGGHKYETFKTPISLTDDACKGVSIRQCKRKKDSSPCLAVKRPQIVSQSLPANLIQGIEECRYIYTYSKEYL